MNEIELLASKIKTSSWNKQEFSPKIKEEIFNILDDYLLSEDEIITSEKLEQLRLKYQISESHFYELYDSLIVEFLPALATGARMIGGAIGTGLKTGAKIIGGGMNAIKPKNNAADVVNNAIKKMTPQSPAPQNQQAGANSPRQMNDVKDKLKKIGVKTLPKKSVG